MAQTVQLKRSAVPGKVPTTSDLALGEIAINTYDGKLFTKKDNGTPSIVEIGAGGGGGGTTNLSTTANSSTVVVASDTGTDATLVGANSSTAGLMTASAQTLAGDKTFNGSVLLDNGAADEGGELRLAAAVTNSSLNGPIAIDIYQNRLRIFETGGSNRGAYIDLTSASTGVGSNLLTGGSSNTVPTNLSLSANGSTVSIFSDTGTDVVIVAANETTAGVLTAEAQSIAGTKTFTSTISGSITGNAGTATAWQTARTFTIGSNSKSVDGTGNLTWTLSEIGASPTAGSSSLTTLGTITTGTWNGSVISSTYGGTGVNNGSNTITLGGNINTANSFSTVGNYTLSLTTTAATNLTLPTTGTLSTLSGSETLTNKTLSSAVLTGSLTANSSVGSAGQVLTSNGSGVYWSTVTGGGGGSTGATISDTAPSSPTAGQLWFDSTSASLAIYYTDADSSQWVEVVGPTGPTGPENSVARALAMTFVFN